MSTNEINKIKMVLACLGLTPEQTGFDHGWSGFDADHPHRRLFIRRYNGRLHIDDRTFDEKREAFAIAKDFFKRGYKDWREDCDKRQQEKTKKECKRQRLLDRAIRVGQAMNLEIDDIVAQAKKYGSQMCEFQVEIRNYRTCTTATVHQDYVDIKTEIRDLDLCEEILRKTTFTNLKQYELKKGES